MIPDIQTAEEALKTAHSMNPGPWADHSRSAALAARSIAGRCAGLDGEKAYVLGLLYDIGRRTGVTALRHTIDGYDFALSRGRGEVARVCLTHSFPVKDIEADIGKKDVTSEQYAFIKSFLDGIEYDDYDKLIILCDALADAGGFCVLEKRFVDTARRYGVFPFTLERWSKTYEYKNYFEKLAGESLYRLLPGIESSIYR